MRIGLIKKKKKSGSIVGRFEKVSFKEFEIRMNELIPEFDGNIIDVYDNITLPTRKTLKSAGYDFEVPFDLTLKPNETMIIPTGIKVDIDFGWWLMMAPRSGLGIRMVHLTDTIAVIDGDYYNCKKNEGNIILKIHNFSNETVIITKKDSFVQGIFIPCGFADCDTFDQKERIAGFGSTNEKK